MSHIGLSHPWMLVVALIPAVLALLRWITRRRPARTIPLAGFGWLPATASRQGISATAHALRCGAMLLLIPVAAGVRWQSASAVSPVKQALVIVLDVSTSMTADDFTPDGRLGEARKSLRQLVSSAAAELGLVTFAAAPRLVLPVTADREAAAHAMSRVLPAGYGEDGTAIGTAIASAINRLRGGAWEKRRILLVTDGVNNGGAVAPLDAARVARLMGITIDAIGIGTDSSSHFSVPTAEGVPLRLEARIEIDEKTLQQVATETGGSYTRVRNSGELSRALVTIAGLQHSILNPEGGNRLGELLTRGLAFAALCLAVAAFILANLLCAEVPD
jgi:Ca-activated chloride channel homolog